MKLKFIMAACLVWMTLTSSAQYGSILEEKLPPSPDSQLKSVVKALPSYYTLETSGDGYTTITLNSKVMVMQSGIDFVRLNLVAVVGPNGFVPDTVELHFESFTDPQQFYKGTVYPVLADGETITPKSCEISIVGDSHVSDVSTQTVLTMDSKFSIEQFKKIAWAGDVTMDGERTICQIPASERQKWKLLWKYFDLLKQKYQNQNP